MPTFGKCLYKDLTTHESCTCQRFKLDNRPNADLDICKACRHDDSYHEMTAATTTPPNIASANAGPSASPGLTIPASSPGLQANLELSSRSTSQASILIPRLESNLFHRNLPVLQDQVLQNRSSTTEAGVQAATAQVFRSYPVPTSNIQLAKSMRAKANTTPAIGRSVPKGKIPAQPKLLRTPVTIEFRFLLSCDTPIDPLYHGHARAPQSQIANRMYSRGMFQ